MIVAGIKLTILGMTVVFCFLMLLILCMKISFRILSAGSAREFAEMEATELNKKRRSLIKTTEDKVLVAIISAAVSAHRARARMVK
jgi:sodium pump decarboxylase gamma subunit